MQTGSWPVRWSRGKRTIIKSSDQNGIACYAGFSPDTNGQILYKEFIKYFMQTKIGKKKAPGCKGINMNKARKKRYIILITM